ncbi:MAG: protein-tyrosine kinase, partial [Mesorhizobium sp.]
MASPTDNPRMIREFLPLDVREVFDFFLRRWKLVCGIAVITFTLFMAAAYTLPTTYTGVSQILLDAPIDYMTPQDYSNSDFSDNPTFIESQIAVLRSASLLQQVVDSQKLAEDPKIGPGALIWLQNALGVSRVGLGNVIELDVGAYDPEKAASLANAIAQAYVADRIRSRYEGVQKASSWLSDRAAYLRAELSRSEQAVQKFRIDHNLVATQAGSLTDQQLSELNVALINARAELSEKRSQYQQVSKVQAAGGDIQSIPDVLQSVVINALRAQLSGVTRREADLKLKYGERHPEVLSAQAERRDIEGQIAAEVQRLIGNLKNEVDAAEAREASLARALDSVSNRSEIEGQVGVQLRDLERIAAANKELFETFLSRAKLTEEKSTLLNSGVRVITDASVPGAPSFPNRPLFAALGVVFGIFFGGAGAVLRELFASGFMAKKQIEEELAVPVLASMPRMSGWSKDVHAQPVAYLERKPLSRYSEAVRR